VKLIDRDERGRLRLSMKALEPKPEGTVDEVPEETAGAAAGEGGERPERGERRGGRGEGRRRS
jgi:polyribonucleotide nucleotidyltransferase